MKILVVGGGGREHALAWKIAQSPQCEKLYCSPGNAGIRSVAECVKLDLAAPYLALIQWCKSGAVDLVVVGPEDPLAAGMVDALEDAGLKAFGPRAAAARLEASKAFAKDIMKAAGIPTGASETFREVRPALAYLDKLEPPYVIKADGLAAGKGVTLAETLEEAQAAVRASLEDKRFGEAGSEILIEQFLHGTEASLLAFADGKTVVAMDSAQDHKAAYDGDKGPNTGGMGALSPAPVLSPALRECAIKEILEPTLAELTRRGITYKGVLYAGLMITERGPEVIEFNCRFGDPEVQALLPRLVQDIVPIMVACADGKLHEQGVTWRPESCLCLVAASGGYPGHYEKGRVITGLEDAAESDGDAAVDQIVVFHAGTAMDDHGNTVTAGGRVLGVTALGSDLESARSKAYAAMEKIHFDDMHFRTDIGFRASGAPV